MALSKGWITVNPNTGTGNKTVTITAAENNGRNTREVTLTWTGAGVENVYRNVKQAGRSEYADLPSSASAIKEGQVVTITGESNSSTLSFSLGSGNLEIELPSVYTAAGTQVNNGLEIPGDPGATNKYTFSISISVPANNTIDVLTRQIIATTQNGERYTCTLSSQAGDAFLTVAEGDILFGWHGDDLSVAVTSNIKWTIS